MILDIYRAKYDSVLKEKVCTLYHDPILPTASSRLDDLKSAYDESIAKGIEKYFNVSSSADFTRALRRGADKGGIAEVLFSRPDHAPVDHSRHPPGVFVDFADYFARQRRGDDGAREEKCSFPANHYQVPCVFMEFPKVQVFTSQYFDNIHYRDPRVYREWNRQLFAVIAVLEGRTVERGGTFLRI
jgi:hypothetical protein